MVIKEQVKNNIMMAMRIYLEPVNLNILESVLIREFSGVDFSEIETLPSTLTDVNEYIINLYVEKRTNKISKNTIDYYISTVRQLIDITHKSLIKIEQNDIELYLNYLRSCGNSNTSLNNRRRNLCAFFDWMRKNKFITDNPVEIIEPYPVQRKQVEIMNSEEIELLKEACETTRDRALIEFFRCSACRVGEIPYIKISDVNWNNGEVIVYGEKTRDYRTVMLDDVALQYLNFYLKERDIDKYSTEALFTHMKGDTHKALSADGIYYTIKQLAKRSKVTKNIYPHLWRKTTATRIAQKSGSDEMAGEYLGHTPKTVTGQHYIRKDKAHIVEIFNKYVRE